MPSVESPSTFDVTLGGIPLKVIPDPQQPDQRADAGYSGTFLPQDSARRFERRDVAEYHRTFGKGAGFVEDDGTEGSRGGYAWAENADMWSGNGIRPSGRQQNVGLGLGLGYTASDIKITDSVVFAGHLWAITNHGKVLYFANADPESTPVENPPSGLAFNGGSTGFRADYVALCMAVFTDDAATPAIYVGCAGPSNEWRIYEYTVAGGWVESGLMGFPVVNMRSVWWEGEDGVGAERLCVDKSGSTIVHCRQGNDPLLPASYETPIVVGNAAFDIRSMAAAPGHLYPIKGNGIHDFNELRSWNVTPNWELTASVSQGNVSLVYDDHLYASKNAGLDRYDLRLNGQQDRLVGECGPGFAWQDGTPIRGYITALCVHDGWLVAALYNPDNETSYIGRAKDRRVLNKDIGNPLVWHWAEQVLTPVDGKAVIVSHMRVVPPEPVVDTPAGPANLLMFARVGSGANYDTDLYYAPLPSGSGPLSLQLSGGNYEYNPTAKVYFTALIWGDRNAVKSVRLYDLVSRTTTATSTIAIYSRADGNPTSITTLGTWTLQGTATSNSTSIIPTTGVVGKSIAMLLVLTTPSPYTAPPIFHELSPRARVVRQSFNVRKIWCLLEHLQETKLGTVDPRSPSTRFDAIAAFQDQATAVTYVDELGRSYDCYVEQGLEYETVVIDGRPRYAMGLELSIIRAT